MIKRMIRKKDVPVEALGEEKLSNFKGIDVTSPPSNLNTLQDMENFDVNLDNSVSLRKPLLLKKTYTHTSVNNTNNYRIFDGSDLSIYKDGNNIKFDIDGTVYPLQTNTGTLLSTGSTYTTSFIELNKIKVVNTNTSSLIFGIRFNLKTYSSLNAYAKNYNLSNTTDFEYRPVRIIKENNTYKFIIMQIETPELYVDPDTGTSRVYFNLLNDYQYSFKDNYNSAYTYSYGAILYTPSSTMTLNEIKAKTVEQLTESSLFKLVDSLNKNSLATYYVLKAFLTVADNTKQDVYCTWEKTYDNVNWEVVDSIRQRSDAITVPVTDNSKSYESLDSSYNATRDVKYVPLKTYNGSTYTNLANTDTLNTRPDVLIISEIDDATYRFSIRSIPKNLEFDTLSSSLSPSSSNLRTEQGENYLVFDNSGTASINFVVRARCTNTLIKDRVKLVVKTVFDNNGITSSYNKSFSNSLTDATLASIADSAVPTLSYGTTSGTPYTDITINLSIPIKLARGWLGQKASLLFTLLYRQTTSYSEISSEAYNVNVIYDVTNYFFDNTRVQNKVFKYAEEVAPFTEYESSDPNDLACDLHLTLVRSDTQHHYCTMDNTTDNGIFKVVLNYLTSLSSNTVAKSLLSLETLKTLSTVGETPVLSVFNNFEYYFKPIKYPKNMYIRPIIVDSQSNPVLSQPIQIYTANESVTLMNLQNRILESTSLIVAAPDTAHIFPVVIEGTKTQFDVKYYVRTIPFSDDTLREITFTSLVSESVEYYNYNSNTNSWGKSTSTVEHLTNATIQIHTPDGDITRDLNATDYTPESYKDSSDTHPVSPYEYTVWKNCYSDDTYSLRYCDASGDAYTIQTYDTLLSVLNNISYSTHSVEEYLTTYKTPEDTNVEDFKTYSLELATTIYTPMYSSFTEDNKYKAIAINDDTVKHIYYNYRVWYFGKSLENNIYYSNSDSMTVPIENNIALNTDVNDFVTAIVPWRDYLIITTKSKIFLVSKLGDGFSFKLINTFIGVPEGDADTCKAILNGIIFKSGSKIYTLQPSYYSSDETILNIADISERIAPYLEEASTRNFAISTEQEYYLCLASTVDNVSKTVVLKYDYSRKIWVKHTYPVYFNDYSMLSVDDILIDANYTKCFYFEKTLDWYKTNEPSKISSTFVGYGDFLNSNTCTPIAFKLDFGQKSLNMQVTKRFSETKLIVQNLDSEDTVFISIKILIDGILSVWGTNAVTTDAHSDDYFSKSPTEILTLENNIVNNYGTDLNRVRQLILRYLSKGKTIQHMISGNSSSNFKIYMLYYRYRIPHTKQ